MNHAQETLRIEYHRLLSIERLLEAKSIQEPSGLIDAQLTKIKKHKSETVRGIESIQRIYNEEIMPEPEWKRKIS